MKPQIKNISWCAGALALFSLVGCGNAQKTEPSKPNIVYILADDLGFGDVSCLNPHSKVQTPAIDNFAKQGITFTNALTASSVCTPTRYTILTGRYSWRGSLKTQVIEAHEPEVLERGRATVASMLKKQGYNTACIGKWHLGVNFSKIDSTKPLVEGKRWNIKSSANIDYDKDVTGSPTYHGFDYGYIIPGSLDMFPYCYIENGHILGNIERRQYGMTKQENRGLNYRDGDTAKGFEHEDVLGHFTQKVTSTIADLAKKEEPFFVYFPMTAPHTPWVPTEEFRGKSKAGYYGDFVAMVDAMVDKVLKSIDDAGVRENTIVIVTSDNGSDRMPHEIKKFDHDSNYGRRGRKAGYYDGGFHVPFMVRWPGVIQPGNSTNKTICSVDLYATLAEMLNVPVGNNTAEDSESFLSQLTGKASSPSQREALINHSFWGTYTIRKGDWKYIDLKGNYETTSEKGELYNIKSDVMESKNVLEQNPQVGQEMRTLLEKIKRQN
ncbi:sulfatase [Prolixibacteraceae bacterium JC049]|nr:sulfatase [Prolixibacteraceae bacterium JC049]